MNRIILFFRRTARVQIDGDEPYRCINQFINHRIAYWDLAQGDPRIWYCTILLEQWEDAQRLALDAMCSLTLISKHGLQQHCYGLVKRPVLILFFLLTALWIIMMPHFIWTITVEGTAEIPDEQILQALEEIGIRTGTWTASIPHPRLLKYEMQLRIPELQWIAVNCYGGRATVEVTERQPAQKTVSKKSVCNLVAARDGVILELSVLNGFPVCQPGQAVREGELLVSGFMDHVLTTQATRAYGEVYALTKHEIQTVLPDTQIQKMPTDETAHCVYLNIGKNRIKIFGNSGISVSGCDKIIRDIFVTLPSSEKLPCGLSIETYRFYEDHTVPLPEGAAQQILAEGAERILQREWIAGTVQSVEEDLSQCNTYYSMVTHALCREMIARAEEVNFQITKEDSDGTNHQRGTN